MNRTPSTPPLYFGSALADLDPKGLVTIPAFLRAAGDPGERAMALFAHPRFPCLVGLHENRLEAAASMPEAAIRHGFAMADSVPLDRKGRILLPARLRALAKLDDRVLFVGCGPTFETWNPAVAIEQGGEALRALAAAQLDAAP